MLPATHRLSKEDVARIMHRGARATNNELALCYTKVTQGTRFAFVVSSKIDKRATHRNKIRRVLREEVHHLLSHIKPVDAVIIARNRNVVSGSVQTLLQKEELLQ